MFRLINWVLITAFVLSACQPGANNSIDSDTSTASESDQPDNADDLVHIAAAGEYSGEHLCSQGFDLGFVDLNAAAQTPSLNPDFSAGTLGLAGAEALVASFFSPADTFCGAELSAETQEKLEQIDQLIEVGNVPEARQQLENLLRELQTKTRTTKSAHVLASLALQLNKEQTYHFVKTFLSSAARFQVLGLEELAQEAIDEAQDTFSDWAEVVLESSTDIKELLGIAAQYQLLGGLESLDQDAIEKAAELAEKKVLDLLSRFNPCEAKEIQIIEILQALAISQALGGGDQASTEMVLQSFEIARRNNKAKAEGESIPECEGAWVVELVGSYSGFEVDFSVRSCDGVNWEGEHTHKGSMLGGVAIIDLAAMFNFAIPDAGASTTISSGVVTYDATGTWIVTTEDDSAVATISNNFSFGMELDRLDSSALVDIVSNGAVLTIEGQSVPVPQLFGPGEDIPASVSLNDDC